MKKILALCFVFLFLIQLQDARAKITYDCVSYYGYCDDVNAVLEVYRFKDYIPVAIHTASKNFFVKRWDSHGKWEYFEPIGMDSLIIELVDYRVRNKRVYFDTQDEKFIPYKPTNNFEECIEIWNLDTFVTFWYELGIQFSQNFFSIANYNLIVKRPEEQIFHMYRGVREENLPYIAYAQGEIFGGVKGECRHQPYDYRDVFPLYIIVYGYLEKIIF